MPRGLWVALPSAATSSTSSSTEFPSLLAVPEHCRVAECPLVVVHHPRGQTADRLQKSSAFQVLTTALLAANFAVLLSSDGGPTSWGSPLAYRQVAAAHHLAAQRFHWNGRTYALGLSMGGLMALRSAQPEAAYVLSGLALIDAWTNLPAAWHSDASRQGEMQLAYQSTTPPLEAFDLLAGLQDGPRLPMLVAASPDDRVVPKTANSDLVYPWAEQNYSEFVTLSGPHLGGNRFSPLLAAQLVAFFQGLEERAELLENVELPL